MPTILLHLMLHMISIFEVFVDFAARHHGAQIAARHQHIYLGLSPQGTPLNSAPQGTMNAMTQPQGKLLVLMLELKYCMLQSVS